MIHLELGVYRKKWVTGEYNRAFPVNYFVLSHSSVYSCSRHPLLGLMMISKVTDNFQGSVLSRRVTDQPTMTAEDGDKEAYKEVHRSALHSNIDKIEITGCGMALCKSDRRGGRRSLGGDCNAAIRFSSGRYGFCTGWYVHCLYLSY